MHLQTFVHPDLAIHSYLLVDSASSSCIAIDPPRCIAPLVQAILSKRATLQAIVETHVHADFVSGAKELKAFFENRPQICCSAEGGDRWLPLYADRAVKDGDLLSIDGLTLKAIHTPGHTPEHLSWLYYEEGVAKCAFTGDFLLVGGVGRPDLLGEEMTSQMVEALYHTLFERIQDLPPSIKIFPGHGAGSLCGKASAEDSSTLERERLQNPAFRWRERSQWQKELMRGVSARPQTFTRNKRINVEGAKLLQQIPTPYQGGELTIDFRDPIAFSQGHRRGAINVPWSASAGNWLAGVLRESETIVAILPEEEGETRIEELIRLLGYDQPITFIDWHPQQKESSLELLSPQEVKSCYLIDVRTPEEWREGYVECAHLIELFELEEKLEHLPTDQKIVTMCRSGMRSSIAASLIQRAGLSAAHLRGGINRWRAEALAIYTPGGE